MTEQIFDYSDFIELSTAESNGVFNSSPSISEVLRSADRYIDMTKLPSNPFAIDKKYFEHLAINVWHYYRFGRLGVLNEFAYFKLCPYCSTELIRHDNPSNYSDYSFDSVYVAVCNNCGWWESEETLKYDTIEEVGKSIHRRAILKQFDIYGCETPINLLKEYISKHPHKIGTLSPRKTEELVASIFRDFYSCEAINVGGPNDKGIDIILINGDIKYAIQVKRRADMSKTEPVKNIREFIGAMILGSYAKGIYVTTAHKFSDQAIIASEQIAQLSSIEYIELCDGNKLADLCANTINRPTPPWRKNASKSVDIPNHVSDGFQTFVRMGMGHEDWAFDWNNQ